MPSQPDLNHLQIHISAIDADGSYSAAIAVLLGNDGQYVPAKHQGCQVLLGSLTVRHAYLRCIDTRKSQLMLRMPNVKQGHFVAIRHTNNASF
ncbi:MAG: hypothetical protein RIR09_1891 [Pseudomonadota bacterium]